MRENMEARFEVTFDDQQKINKFAKLHDASEIIHEELMHMKKMLEGYSAANDEISLLDDDKSIPYSIGDCFFLESLPGVEEKLNKETKKIEKLIVKTEEKYNDCVSKMEELKSELYAKFGSNINLESK